MQSFFENFDDEVEKFLESSKPKSKLLVNYTQSFSADNFESFQLIEKKDESNQIEVVIKKKTNGRKKGKQIF
jgi:hypothetical protein